MRMNERNVVVRWLVSNLSTCCCCSDRSAVFFSSCCSSANLLFDLVALVGAISCTRALFFLKSLLSRIFGRLQFVLGGAPVGQVED